MQLFGHSSLTKKHLFAFGMTLLLLGGLLVIEMCRILLLPRVLSLETDPKVPENGRHGFLFASVESTVDVRVSMQVYQNTFIDAPRHVRFFSSGRMEIQKVNGVEYPTVIPNGEASVRFQRGMNTLEAVVHLTEEKPLFYFGLRPTFLNAVSVFFFLVGACMIFLWLWGMRTVYQMQDSLQWGIVIFGSILRYLYAFATPYYINAYDFNDHVQYVQYLTEHWRMPHTVDMWQGFQMPLYYILLTPIFSLGKSFGFHLHEIGELLTVPSIILSLLTLFLFALIFSRYSSSLVIRRLCLFTAAVFPGVVYLSGQVSNDTLVTSIGFLWVFALLWAWEAPEDRKRWMYVAVLCGVGMLVKMSAAPWTPISLCLFAWVAIRRSLPQAIRTVAYFCVLVFLAGGWLYVFRLLTDEHFHLVANTSFPSLMQVLPINLTTIFGFSPVRLLKIPFDAQSSTSALANVYSEDLIRTAHFGSFLFPQDAAILLVLWMMTLPFLALGVWQEIRLRRPLLIGVSFALVLAGLFMRLRYPYVPCQHFRFIAVVFLPMLLLTKEGLLVLQGNRYLAPLSHVLIAVYGCVCAALLLSVSIAS